MSLGKGQGAIEWCSRLVRKKNNNLIMVQYGSIWFNMALINYIDGTTSPRRIYLDASTVGTSFHPIDLYKEMRVLRRTNTALRQYDLFMEAFGNVSKGGGKFTERYVRLNNCVIVPFDTDHTITVTGTIISDAGLEGILVFDTALLSPSTAVSINYVPPQVEVIQVNTGSGVSAQDVIDIAAATAADVWNAGTRTLTVPSGITPPQEAKIDAIQTIVDALPILSDIRAEMINIQFGALEITNDQMIIKDKLGVVVAILNLFDKDGNPSMNSVFKREVVS